MSNRIRRRNPWWRFASLGLAVAVFLVAIVMLVRHVQGWLTVFDIGIAVILVSNVAWLIVRDRYVQSPDTDR